MGLINNKLALLMGTTVAITSTLLTNTKVKADTDANSSSKEVTVQMIIKVQIVLTHKK